MKINLMAPINQLGYGIAGLNILRAFDAIGYEPCLWPILNNCEVSLPGDKYIVERALARQDRYDASLPCLRIWHQWSMAENIGNNNIHCGLPFFELDGFTDRELHHLNGLDIIFVPSQWAKDVLIEAFVKKVLNTKSEIALREIYDRDIVVAPLGVDRAIFHPETVTEIFGLPCNKHTTVFINIGKWELRKGHDVLINAFCEAFRRDDNVCLLMVCDNPFLSAEQQKQWKELYETSKMGSRILFLDRYKLPTQIELAKVMNWADCGVFPARAEGWNLEALEMLSCGKKVILTNYSGHTAYANSENASLIQPDNGLVQAFDGMFFKNSPGRWLCMTSTMVKKMAFMMREIHEEKQKNKGILPINQAGIATAQLFSWRRTVDSITEGLNNYGF